MANAERKRVRAGAIVVRGSELLVVHRRRDGREYYTFPGGMIEEGESPEEAVVRELREETSVEAEVERLCYELRQSPDSPHRNGHEYFFLCRYITGEPMLAEDSIEKKINDPERNFFEPKWIALVDVHKGIQLFPTEVAGQLFHDLEYGFKDVPVVIEGSSIGG